MAATTTLSDVNRMQPQIARIRREEEEETWISGEELNTEGSSDDEGSKSQKNSMAKRRLQHQILARRISAPAHLQHPAPTSPPIASFEPITFDEPHLTETSRRLSQMTVGSHIRQRSPRTPQRRSSEEETKKDRTDIDEQEEVMLWRPKRGSIKLPHIDLEKSSTSRLTQEKVSG